MSTVPSSRLRILAAGISEFELGFIAKEGVEVIVALDGSKGIVLVHCLDETQYLKAASLPDTVSYSPAKRKMACIAS